MNTPPRFAAQTTVESPLGALTLAADDAGLGLVWFDAQQHRSAVVDAPERPTHPVLRLAVHEFERYWRDGRAPFAVPLAPRGTPFQQRVWAVLRRIAPGALMSYAEVARAIGQPNAMRAAGAAIGRNPLSVIVPCHRVVGSDGTLTGYAGGLPRKQWLLEHEGALLPLGAVSTDRAAA